MQVSAPTPEIPPRVVGRPFTPGFGGNPSGRPKKTAPEREAEALARAKTPVAMRKLVQMIEDDETSEGGRLRAIELLLDRGLGKATPAPEVNLAGLTFTIQTIAMDTAPVPGVITTGLTPRVLPLAMTEIAA